MSQYQNRRRLAARSVVRLFSAAVFAAAAARPLAAQEAITRDAALEIRKQFVADLDSLQSKFLQLANAIPEDKYSWRPGAGVRSIGEAFMHVASEYYVYTPMSYGAPPSPVVGHEQDSFKKFESMSTKADVLKHLNEGFAYMRQSLTGLDPVAITGTKKLFGKDRTIAETTLIMSDDLHEHLGQLIAYSRMNGIRPPWSR